jgi:hypothetical protein
MRNRKEWKEIPEFFVKCSREADMINKSNVSLVGKVMFDRYVISFGMAHLRMCHSRGFFRFNY